MPSVADRIDFGPPRDAGSVRAFGLALLAHGLLIAALTWGVNWKRTDNTVSFEAEIWSTVRQEAAPKLVEPPPAPPPPPPGTPEPVVKTAPPAPDVDIALEQEKKRKLVQQKQQQQQQKEAELLAEKEKEKERELKLKEDQVKRKTLDDAKKTEVKKQELKEQASATGLAEQRKQNLARAMGLAGATGAEDAKGLTQKSGGSSASYKARLAALFKRNISFANVEGLQGNPKAIVQVKVASSGLIIGFRLTKSSGNPAWDDAVLRAVEKTERIPTDENGRVVSDFPVEFGPKD